MPRALTLVEMGCYMPLEWNAVYRTQHEGHRFAEHNIVLRTT